MEKEVNIPAWLFSCIFTLLLSISLIYMKIPSLGISLKGKTPFNGPKPICTETNWYDYPQVYQDWFVEKIPFRNLCINFHTRFWTAVLHSNTKKYVAGSQKDFFLEFSGAKTVSDYLGLNPLSEKHLNQLLEIYIGTQLYCESHGANYVLLLIPSKPLMQEETLPDWIKSQKKQSCHYEQIAAFLSDTELNFISLKEALLEKKSDNLRIFNRIFDIAHWNGHGLDISTEIILKWMGNGINPDEKKYDILYIKPHSWQDGIERGEPIPFITIKDQKALKLQNEKYSQLSLKDTPAWMNPDYTINTKNPLGPNIALLCNSYFKDTHQTAFPGANANIHPLASYAHEFFCSHYTHFDKKRNFDWLMQNVKPDFVIEAISERSGLVQREEFFKFIGKKYLHPEIQWDSYSLMDLVKENDFNHVNIKFEENENSLVHISATDDPSIVFRKKFSNTHGFYYFYVTIESPAETFCQLFYKEIEGEFSEKNSIKQKLYKGENIVVLSVQLEAGKTYMFRFDPIAAEGKYSFKPLPQNIKSLL